MSLSLLGGQAPLSFAGNLRTAICSRETLHAFSIFYLTPACMVVSSCSSMHVHASSSVSVTSRVCVRLRTSACVSMSPLDSVRLGAKLALPLRTTTPRETLLIYSENAGSCRGFANQGNTRVNPPRSNPPMLNPCILLVKCQPSGLVAQPRRQGHFCIPNPCHIYQQN